MRKVGEFTAPRTAQFDRKLPATLQNVTSYASFHDPMHVTMLIRARQTSTNGLGASLPTTYRRAGMAGGGDTSTAGRYTATGFRQQHGGEEPLGRLSSQQEFGVRTDPVGRPAVGLG